MSKWVKGLEKLWDYHADVINAIPEARRIALEAAGEKLKEEVNRQIDLRLPNHDRRGRVKSWQEVTMGSRGGYVKVSPRDETVAESAQHWFRSTEKYSAHDITFWLEHGHKMVLPKRNRYGTVTWSDSDNAVENASTGELIVKGRMFYSWAWMAAPKLAKEAAEAVLEQLSDEFVDMIADYVDREG